MANPGPIADHLTGWPHAFRDNDWLRFKDPVSEDGARWWNRRFRDRIGMLPGEFVKAITRGTPGFTIATFENFDHVGQTFEIVIQGVRDAPGSTEFPVEIFLKRQRFEVHLGVASKGLTKVAPEHQGEGIGTLLMINLVDLALDCGMDRVDMEADDIGRYAWPTMGFVPATDDVWTSRVAPAARRRFRAFERLDWLTPQARREIQVLLALPDRLAARALVLYPGEVSGTGPRGMAGNIPVGRFLLLDDGPAWKATLDLRNDEEGLDLFRAYKERHRVEHTAPRP